MRLRRKSDVETRGANPGLTWKLPCLSVGGVRGIPGVAVECVKIRKNNGGVGGLLGDE